MPFRWHICGMSTTASGSLASTSMLHPPVMRASALARHQRGQRAFESAQIQFFRPCTLLPAWRSLWRGSRRRFRRLAADPLADRGDLRSVPSCVEKRMSSSAAIRRESSILSHIVRTLCCSRRVKPDSARAPSSTSSSTRRATRPTRPRSIIWTRCITYGAAGCPRQCAMRIGRMAQGIERGDCVALLMENRPDYICAGWACSRSAPIAALINTNLRGQPLAHSIAIAGARHADPRRRTGRHLCRSARRYRLPPAAWVQGGAASGCSIWMRRSRQHRTAPPITPARRRHVQGQRILHLHLRHHGPAQGRAISAICACCS